MWLTTKFHIESDFANGALTRSSVARQRDGKFIIHHPRLRLGVGPVSKSVVQLAEIASVCGLIGP